MGRKVASNHDNGPSGTIMRASGRHGPQRIETTGRFWSDEAETLFLDHLAATCNVTLSAREAGFSSVAVYRRRSRDPRFAARWRVALAQGYARLEAALVRCATETFEGEEPDPDAPIPPVSVADALNLLRLHQSAVRGEGDFKGGRRPRPRSLDEVRGSILVKLEAIVAMSEKDAAADGTDVDEP